MNLYFVLTSTTAGSHLVVEIVGRTRANLPEVELLLLVVFNVVQPFETVAWCDWAFLDASIELLWNGLVELLPVILLGISEMLGKVIVFIGLKFFIHEDVVIVVGDVDLLRKFIQTLHLMCRIRVRSFILGHEDGHAGPLVEHHLLSALFINPFIIDLFFSAVVIVQNGFPRWLDVLELVWEFASLRVEESLPKSDMMAHPLIPILLPVISLLVLGRWCALFIFLL